MIPISVFQKIFSVFKTGIGINKQYRTDKCRAVFLFAGKPAELRHFGFLDSEHHTKQSGKHLRTLDHNNFHSLHSLHSLNSNIPTTISAAAIMNSKHFAEKIARQTAAPKNAQTARIVPTLQFLRGPLGRRIPFTSLSDLSHFIPFVKFGYRFSENI